MVGCTCSTLVSRIGSSWLGLRPSRQCLQGTVVPTQVRRRVPTGSPPTSLHARYCVAATGHRTINMKRLERCNPLHGSQCWVAYIRRRGRGAFPNLARGSRPRCGSSRRLLPLAGRRTSSNPSITLPCSLAPGLHINQSAVGQPGFADSGSHPVLTGCSSRCGKGGRSFKLNMHVQTDLSNSETTLRPSGF